MERSLAIGVSALLKKMPVDMLLDNLLCPSVGRNAGMVGPLSISLFTEGIFVDALRHSGGTFMISENESHNIYSLLQQKQKETDFEGLGIFSLIYLLASQHIYFKGQELLCRQDDFVLWREAIHGFGQTPFICAYRAGQDIRAGYKQAIFSDGPYLKTDDFHLREILSHGVADNHFHLGGSSPTFLINWICLMNRITNRAREFNNLNYSLNTSGGYQHKRDLPVLARIAAGLRYFLWCLLCEDAPGDPSDMLRLIDGVIDGIRSAELQSKINVARMMVTDRQIGHTASLDYTLDPSRCSGPYAAIAGENCFQYHLFHSLFSKKESVLKYIDYAYAYLLIYCIFRSELVQDNDLTGFANFKNYQDRKTLFIDERRYPHYAAACTSIAFESALSTMDMRSLEARIIPSTRHTELSRKVGTILHALAKPANGSNDGCMNYTFEKGIDMHMPLSHRRRNEIYQCLSCKKFKLFSGSLAGKVGCCTQKMDKLSLVMHIPKEIDNISKKNNQKNLSYDTKENDNRIDALVKCRHYSYRRYTVRPMVNSVLMLRQKRSNYATMIYALDACSAEIGCRPEVFAPAFRMARAERPSKHHITGTEYIPPLHITYHVGEDFLDIVDGLRAIDEAIRFLEMKNSDRLGHALALGISPWDYYSKKSFSVYLPRHDLLDNVAWLFVTFQRFNIHVPDLQHELRETFREQYNYVYTQNIPNEEKEHLPSMELYYDAWKLRGDDPVYYKSEKTDFGVYIRRENFLHPGALQSNIETENIRLHDRFARKLYHNYHYNSDLKKEGNRIVEYRITPRYAHAVELLQKEMQKNIAGLGISIECNPSSNYLIGTFRDYEKHPIFIFNNDGLELNNQAAQLMTSINTDDQGVFDTDLESEYALIACALKNATDEHGRARHTPASVYKYINKIRKIGLSQSFRIIDKSLFMEGSDE